jgi:hypothetical protein
MNNYGPDFKNVDINEIQRDIQKCLDCIDDLREDLDKHRHEAHPLYLLKQAELLRDACDTLTTYWNIIRDHQLMFPELHIERARQAAKKIDEINKKRFSFRGN